jgi:hypothetical protein
MTRHLADSAQSKPNAGRRAISLREILALSDTQPFFDSSAGFIRSKRQTEDRHLEGSIYVKLVGDIHVFAASHIRGRDYSCLLHRSDICRMPLRSYEAGENCLLCSINIPRRRR